MIIKNIDTLKSMIESSNTLTHDEKYTMLKQCNHIANYIKKYHANNILHSSLTELEAKHPLTTQIIDTLARTCSRLGI